jgi:hypothetical protein
MAHSIVVVGLHHDAGTGLPDPGLGYSVRT